MPPGWAGWAAAAAGVALLGLAVRAGAIAGGAGLLCLGFALAILRAETAWTPVLQGGMREVAVTGRVVDTIGHPDGRPRLLIAVDAIEGLAPEATPRRVRIAMRKADARLVPGAPADLVLFDPDAPFVLDRFALLSKSKNTPFDGARMQGRVLGTWVAGRPVYGDAA